MKLAVVLPSEISGNVISGTLISMTEESLSGFVSFLLHENKDIMSAADRIDRLFKVCISLVF
nr:hypothetical protein [Odoribacter sp. OF09-27XD]